MSKRRGKVLIGSAIAAAIVCVGLAIAIVSDDRGSGRGDGGKRDPGDQTLAGPGPVEVERVQTEGLPAAVAVGAGRIWAADPVGGILERIAPATRLSSRVQVDGFPTDVAGGRSRAWIPLPDLGAVQSVSRNGPANRPSKVDGLPFQLALDSTDQVLWAMSQRSLQPLAADTGDPLQEPIRLDGSASAITAGAGRTWVALGRREVAAFELGEDEPVASARLDEVFALALGEGSVWALSAPGQVSALDPDRVARRFPPIRVRGALALAAGLGCVWVVTDAGALVRLDPDTGRRVGEAIDVGRPLNAGEPGYAPLPADVAVGAGAAWVAGPGGRSLIRVSARCG